MILSNTLVRLRDLMEHMAALDQPPDVILMHPEAFDAFEAQVDRRGGALGIPVERTEMVPARDRDGNLAAWGVRMPSPGLSHAILREGVAG